MGCVRMPYDFAKLLFAETSTGITVVVSDEKSFPATVSNPGLFAPIDTKGELANVPQRDGKYYAWEPELATEGPISILVIGCGSQHPCVPRVASRSAGPRSRSRTPTAS